MLKAGVYALLALGIFALVFALLPQRPLASARTGATLRGVTLTLYPSRDPDAVWRFRAADVTSDPLKEETHLSGLSDGGRWVKGPGGRPRLDATLAAPDTARLHTLGGVDSVEVRGEQVYVHAKDSDVVARYLLTETDARDVEITAHGLEDAFVSLTGRPTDTEGARA